MALLGMVAGGLAAAAVSTSAFRAEAPISVGGHAFSVPRERVLPAPSGQALMFLPDLRAPREERHPALLQPRERVCASDRLEQMVRIACGRETSPVEASPPFQSMDDQVGGHRWMKANREIASCFAMSVHPEKGGMCLVVTSYKDLILTTYLREAELPQLPARIDALRRMLQGWEVR